MNQPITYPPPVLDLSPGGRFAPHPPDEKWERERRAFHRLLPQLLQTHGGHYVAIHDEQVVACGDDIAEVAMQAYREHGRVSIYADLVTTDPPRRVIRIPHIRVCRPIQEAPENNS